MPTLIVLIGPTGVGKTELSLRLAENFHTSIVSADSRQLYAELKIGTAAPTPDQVKRVHSFLVQSLGRTRDAGSRYPLVDRDVFRVCTRRICGCQSGQMAF